MATRLMPPLKTFARPVDGESGVAYPGGARSAFWESDDGRDDKLRTSPSVGFAGARRRAFRARDLGARPASGCLRSVRGLRGASGCRRRGDSLDAVRAADSLVRGCARATPGSSGARDRSGSRGRARGERGCSPRHASLVGCRRERRTARASAGSAGCAAVRSAGARPARARRRLLASVHLPAEIARMDWPRSAGVCVRPLTPTPPEESN
jgi:hypothetical protein